jgi:hypothetical protein
MWGLEWLECFGCGFSGPIAGVKSAIVVTGNGEEGMDAGMQGTGGPGDG